MIIDYYAFILPHIGDLFSQCADRYAVKPPYFAIADGVGASLFPDKWAELVSRDFVEHPTDFVDVKTTKLTRDAALIKEWENYCEAQTKNMTAEEKFLLDLSREKADFAACTFVGLQIDSKQWTCAALGDSYMFLVNKDFEIIEKVASQKDEPFGCYPEYFASKDGQNNGKVVIECTGPLENVAYILLLTDALSEWFIQVDAQKRKELIYITTQNDFQELAERERKNNTLHDDDTTAVILKLNYDTEERVLWKKQNVTEIDKLIESEQKTESTSQKISVSENIIKNNQPITIDIIDTEQQPESQSNVPLLEQVKDCLTECIQKLKQILGNGTAYRDLTSSDRNVKGDLPNIINSIQKQYKKLTKNDGTANKNANKRSCRNGK